MLRVKAAKLLVTAGVVVVSVGFLFSVGMVFNHMMPHQQKRIKVVLGIVDDPRGDSYNVNQSKIAITLISYSAPSARRRVSWAPLR